MKRSGSTSRFAGSPVARVIGAGLKEWARASETDKARGEPAADARSTSPTRSRARSSGSRSASWPACAAGCRCWRRSSSSAPFVGLFGTVGGIITAFQKLADPAKGGGGIGTVSAGIAEALITTAVGLAVAIISVWFYNYFIARIDDITIDIDETASELVDSILREEPVVAERA